MFCCVEHNLVGEISRLECLRKAHFNNQISTLYINIRAKFLCQFVCNNLTKGTV